MKVKKESEKAGLKLNFQKMKIMSSGPITSWQIEGETMDTVRDFIFLGSKITADHDCNHEIKRLLLPGRKAMSNLDSVLKRRNITFLTRLHNSQRYGFSSSYLQMWEMDHKKGWAPENWCFWTVVLEKTLESPINRKEIKLVNPKGNQPWILIGRTDAEIPILWPPDAKNWSIERLWGWERLRLNEKGTTEDEMVRWHYHVSEHEFEQTLGDSKG